MPRTKVSRTKRNRDAAKEEKEEIKIELLREFDSTSEQMEQRLISLYNELIEDNIAKIHNFKLKLTQKIRSIVFLDFIKMDQNAINEFNKTDSVNSTKFINTSITAPTSSTLSNNSSTSKKSKDDEGYLTEDGGSRRTSNSLQLPSFPISVGRTPGPLSSAKAKARGRRSRSTSGLLNSTHKLKQMLSSKSGTSDRASRSKMRTPLLQHNMVRAKAMSADRCSTVTPKISSSNSPVLYRWAKPGETIISLSGSPIVTPMAPESIANINIPTRNGMLSLRSKRADSNEIGRQIVDRICPETLKQIKQLQAHLNVIMSMADNN